MKVILSDIGFISCFGVILLLLMMMLYLLQVLLFEHAFVAFSACISSIFCFLLLVFTFIVVFSVDVFSVLRSMI